MTGRANGVRIVSLPPGTGYGDAAVQYAAGLDQLGAAVRWSPVEWDSTEPMETAQVENLLPASVAGRVLPTHERPLDCDAFLLSYPPPAMHPVWAESERARRLYAFATWETNQLPMDWPPALATFRRIFVPSEYNRALLEAQGPDVPVDVVPHIAREVVADGASVGQDWLEVDPEEFAFYTIGTWYTRKAIEETIRAYLDAFSADDPVVLIVKTTWLDYIAVASVPKDELAGSNPVRFSTGWCLARILADYERPARVHLVAHPLSGRKLDELHRCGDCYVSLSRSEGFGLCPFDALLFGNPVVATSHGGPVEYLGADYPLAVRYELESSLHAPDDNQHMRADDCLWARADRNHASELMRRVFERRDEARSVARQLQGDLRERFSAGRISARLANLMELERS